MAKSKIRIAIAGVGNCASALIQGIHYYTPERCAGGVTGLMHTEIGGYRPRKLIGPWRIWLLERCRSSEFTLRGLVAELAERGLKV